MADIKKRIEVLKKEIAEKNQIAVNAEKSLNDLRLQILFTQGGLSELEGLPDKEIKKKRRK